MGTIAARDALRVLELTEQVAAATLLGALQGLEYRLHQQQLRKADFSQAIETQRHAVRRYSAFLKEDRALENDLRQTMTQIRRRSWPSASRALRG